VRDVPAEAGPSQLQNAASSGSHAAIKPEPEEITVVIKSEDVPDLKTLVTFVKSEDGKFDIWNLEHLGLGPPVVVEERFRVGFTRAAISNVGSGFPVYEFVLTPIIALGYWWRLPNYVQ